MATCTDIRTPFRRPCLLRAVPEYFSPNIPVDVPDCKPSSPRSPHDGWKAYWPGLTTGGAAPDYRAVTVDQPARLSPRCSGLHRDGYGSPPRTARSPSKSDQLRTLQAFGIGNICDVDGIYSRSPRQHSPTSGIRTRMEELSGGVPLAGRGADIDRMMHRRTAGLNLRRSNSPMEEARELDGIDIDNQFRRRHFSAPPESRSVEGFEHILRAEVYANLIGRPEGTGKRIKRSKSARRPFRVDRGLKDSVFSSPAVSPFQSPRLEGRELAEPICGPLSDSCATSPAQSAALIEVLREATRNSPAEAVWDSMLSTMVESPEIANAPDGPLQASLSPRAALLPIGAEASAKRLISPTKNRGRPEDGSPRRNSPTRVARLDLSPSQRSAISAASISTIADTADALSRSGFGSISGASSPGQRQTPRTPGSNSSRVLSTVDCRATWQREEAMKAKRRSGWVS